MRKVPRVVRRRFTLNKTLYEIGMGFIRTEFLRDDSLEEIGVAEVFPQDEVGFCNHCKINKLLAARSPFCDLSECKFALCRKHMKSATGTK